jgi:hypothetical protein
MPVATRRPKPARRTVSSRWRALAVALLVLALVAIIGVVGAATVYLKYVRLQRLPAPPGWGEQQSIVTAFPRLLPVNPTATGWRGASCSAVAVPTAEQGDPVPRRQITCIDGDGVTAWYSEYFTVGDLDAYLAARAEQLGERQTENGSTALLYQPRPDGPIAPFLLASREQGRPAVDTMLIEISWPGNTVLQARTHWWEQAPF